MNCQKCGREIDEFSARVEHHEGGKITGYSHLKCWPANIAGANKYHAIKTEIDGIIFDSLAESRRYIELKQMQDAGEISDLKTHPRFLLQNAFSRDGKKEPAIYYEADFSYHENGRVVVEDVKGLRTPVYTLKRRMFLLKYPEITFVEVKT